MNTMEELSRDDRLNLLNHAQYKLLDAISLIKEAVEGTEEEGMSKVFIIPHLKHLAEGINSYEHTIPKIYNAIEENYGYEDNTDKRTFKTNKQ